MLAVGCHGTPENKPSRVKSLVGKSSSNLLQLLSMLRGNLGRSLLYTCMILTLIADLSLFRSSSTPVSSCIWESCFTKASEWGQMATHGLVLSIPCKCGSLKTLKLRHYLVWYDWFDCLHIFNNMYIFVCLFMPHNDSHERMCKSTSQGISIWTTHLATLPQLCHIVSRFAVLEDYIGNQTLQEAKWRPRCRSLSMQHHAVEGGTFT